jgi:hypothetical protein
MTEEQLEEIFEGDSGQWEGDNAYQGLQILSKYTDNLIQSAGHEVIYSISLSDIAEQITEEDALELRRLNWMIQEGHLACFV